MRNMFSRIRNPALRQGLIFGLIFGFAQVLVGFFIGLGLLILAALYFVVALFAGRRASRETGKVITGAIAGAWTGLFGAGIISIWYVISYFANTDALRNEYQTLNHQTYTNAQALQMAITSLIIFIVLAVLISFGAGALGGLMGRNRATPPADTYEGSISDGESISEPPSTTTRQ